MPLSSLLLLLLPWRRRTPPTPPPQQAHLHPHLGLRALLNHPFPPRCLFHNPQPMAPTLEDNTKDVQEGHADERRDDGLPLLDDRLRDDDDDSDDRYHDHNDDEEEEEEEEECCCWGYYGPRDAGRRFPPPIPVVAKLEENSPRHMPRVMRRTYEAGGRLVIREVELRHHEFLRARRENGRLTLELVHLVAKDGRVDEEEEEEEEERRRTSEVEKEESGGGCSTCTSSENGDVGVARCKKEEGEGKRRVVVPSFSSSSSMTEAVRKGCLPVGAAMFRMAVAPPVPLLRT